MSGKYLAVKLNSNMLCVKAFVDVNPCRLPKWPVAGQ
jgi:hypothetical protein